MPRKTSPATDQLDLLTPATIAYRLDEPSRRVLAHRAARLRASPHELARQYLLETLQAPEEQAAMREAIQQLYQALQSFRSDFAFAVEALLISAGKISKDEARRWVEQSLNPE